MIFIIKLYDLQIVNGQEYRERSNTRLTRETTLKAARGNILDSSGNKLVATSIHYNVEIHKTKIDTQTLNNALLLFAQTLEANGDTYIDQFPMTINPIGFKEDLEVEEWKIENEIEDIETPEECFDGRNALFLYTTYNEFIDELYGKLTKST